MTLEVSVVFTYILDLFFLKGPSHMGWWCCVNLYGGVTSWRISWTKVDLICLERSGGIHDEMMVKVPVPATPDRYASPYWPFLWNIFIEWGAHDVDLQTCGVCFYKTLQSYFKLLLNTRSSERMNSFSRSLFFRYFQYFTWDNQRSLDLPDDLTWRIQIGKVLRRFPSQSFRNKCQRRYVSSNVRHANPNPSSILHPSPCDIYLKEFIVFSRFNEFLNSMHFLWAIPFLLYFWFFDSWPRSPTIFFLPHEQWKEGQWLFRVIFRGWNPPQLCWGLFHKPLIIRIPILTNNHYEWTRIPSLSVRRVFWINPWHPQESWTPSCEWNTAPSCWIPNGQRPRVVWERRGRGIKQKLNQEVDQCIMFPYPPEIIATLNIFAIVLSVRVVMVLDGHGRMTYVNLLTVSIGQVQKTLAVLSFCVSFYAWCFLKTLSDAGVTWPVHMWYVFIVSNLTMNFTGYIIGEVFETNHRLLSGTPWKFNIEPTYHPNWKGTSSSKRLPFLGSKC